RFLAAAIRTAQDHPIDACRGSPLQKRLQRARAADFDIVAMRAKAQDSDSGRSRQVAEQFEHLRSYLRSTGPLAGWRCQIIQGHSPRASIRSKLILSLNVSMHCQKPFHRYAPSLRAAISRANGSST